MSDEREAKIREAASEVFKSFIKNMQVLRPDGGSRSLTTTVTVDRRDQGYGQVVRLVMVEKLIDEGRETTVMDVRFTER